MGAVSSMCCDNDKSSHGDKPLPIPSKNKPERSRLDLDEKK